jgi:eukaryotic-like serine/threonine-protein kinase
MPYPGQIVDGKYRLGGLLGDGGMGWVFEATHLGTDKRVALKYLKPSLRRSARWIRRFAREARAAGALEHPNVIRLYDVGGEGPDLYLVMERLHGETLRARLANGPMDPAAAVEILLAVLRGVAEAHRQGIVHCDLKPENIFLPVLPGGVADQPKVLDFGLAKTVREPASIAHDQTSEIPGAGTPRYMPLEQLRGDPPDLRIDVYALGVVLYETLTGRRPFESRTREELVVKLATESVPSLALEDAELGRRLDRVIERALARDPGERFSSLSEFEHALRSVSVGAVAGALGPEHRHAEPPSRVRRRGVLLKAAATVLSIGLASAGLRALTKDGRADGAAPPPARATVAKPAEASRVPLAPPPPPASVAAPAAPIQRAPRIKVERPRVGPVAPVPSARELQLLRKDF